MRGRRRAHTRALDGCRGCACARRVLRAAAALGDQRSTTWTDADGSMVMGVARTVNAG